jgi:hypothetical protein
MMRAKFYVESVTISPGQERLKFHAVDPKKGYGADGIDEDNDYARWSPSASCEISVANPALHGQFKPGDTFYVTFTRAVADIPEAKAA